MFQTKSSFVGMGLPSTDRLWAEAQHFACDNLNRTATTSNKNMKSPWEMWHGKPPPPTLVQWLQPCFFKTKRKHKTDAQAEPGFTSDPQTTILKQHTAYDPQQLTKSTSPVMSPGTMSRPLPLACCSADTSRAR